MTLQKTISSQALISMAALATVWGLSFVSIRIALNEVGPLTSVAHRTFWAMLVLWGVVLAMRLPVPKDLRVWGAFFVMGMLNNVIPFSLMAWGQLNIESGLTSILNASTAIFGVLVAAFFFNDERLTVSKVVGVVLGFSGVATAVGLESLRDFDIRSLAQIAVIGGAVSYALASAWARRALGHLPLQVAAAGMLTGSSLVMVPLAIWVEGPITLALQTDTLLAISYYAIVATAGAYLLYYRILAMAGSGNLMLVTLMIAPVAILAGALILGEKLPPNAYAGLALLALGLAVLDGRLLQRLRRSSRQIDPEQPQR
mgnify:CR=1 FL=1